MKGYDMQENKLDSIENWTIQQCEEYLNKYSKGWTAERVRARLKKLQPPQKEINQPSNTVTPQYFAGTTLSNTVSSPPSYKPSVNSNDSLMTFLKVIATIVCVGIIILGIVVVFQANNPAFYAVFPFFYFPIKWMSKMWR